MILPVLHDNLSHLSMTPCTLHKTFLLSPFHRMSGESAFTFTSLCDWMASMTLFSDLQVEAQLGYVLIHTSPIHKSSNRILLPMARLPSNGWSRRRHVVVALTIPPLCSAHAQAIVLYSSSSASMYRFLISFHCRYARHQYSASSSRTCSPPTPLLTWSHTALLPVSKILSPR